MKLANYKPYGLHVIQYPSKRWGYVGTIPVILCEEREQKNGLPYTGSKVFDTAEQAVQYFEDHKHEISDLNA